MFQDRTLNWSFAASICANLVFVALVGGSDLLKAAPGRFVPPQKHLPFVEFIDPPTVAPHQVVKTQLAAKTHPVATRPRSVARPALFSRIVPRTNVPVRHPSKPVQIARLDVETPTPDPAQPAFVPAGSASPEGQFPGPASLDSVVRAGGGWRQEIWRGR